MEITKGLIFTGKWFTGIVEVIEVKENTNKLEVKLKSSNESDNWWFETWNLWHTRIGFKNRDYFLKK